MLKKSLIVTENLFSYIALPGILTHEIAHLLACKIVGVQVYDYQLFIHPKSITSESIIAGRVHHDAPKGRVRAAFISLAPLAFNISIAALILHFVPRESIPTVLLSLLIAGVFTLTAFPSDRDLESVGLKLGGLTSLIYYLVMGVVGVIVISRLVF